MIAAQQKSLGVEKVCNTVQFCVVALHQIMKQKNCQAIFPRARVEKKTQDRSSQLAKEQKSPRLKLCAGKYYNVAGDTRCKITFV